MRSPLKMLLKSGLPIDWMTLYVGWQGITIGMRSFKVGDVAIIDFALEALAANVGTPDEDAVFRLADADRNDWYEVARYLSELAERSGISPETGLRKWRYAHVRYTLAGVFGASDWDTRLREWGTLYDLERVWKPLLAVHPLPEVGLSDEQEAIQANLDRLRVWLSEERLSLTETEA